MLHKEKKNLISILNHNLFYIIAFFCVIGVFHIDLDYVNAQSAGSVKSQQKIDDGDLGGSLDDLDNFGSSVASIGDLNKDGVTDIAVGAIGVRGNSNALSVGAVYILFLNEDGTVKTHQKISDFEGEFSGILDDNDLFGTSVTNIDDLDGDGVTDIAVGTLGDDDGGDVRGAVWILFLNENGTVKSHQKISDIDGGFTGSLDDFDRFGKSVASLGDLDGDGVTDIAVGADGDGVDGSSGAVWILFLDENGTVKSHQKISNSEGKFSGTSEGGGGFGTSVTSLGSDLNGDGVVDIAVGTACCLHEILILFLNENGTVESHQKISEKEGGFSGELGPTDRFSNSITSLGDLDGDSVTDIAVGALTTDSGREARVGAVWILFLNGVISTTPVIKPEITSIVPNEAEQGETVTVTLEGSNFTQGMTINISGTAGITISNINVISGYNCYCFV